VVHIYDNDSHRNPGIVWKWEKPLEKCREIYKYTRKIIQMSGKFFGGNKFMVNFISGAVVKKSCMMEEISSHAHGGCHVGRRD